MSTDTDVFREMWQSFAEEFPNEANKAIVEFKLRQTVGSGEQIPRPGVIKDGINGRKECRT